MKRALTIIGSIIGVFLALILVLALVVVGFRVYNAQKYPFLAESAVSDGQTSSDKSSYPTSDRVTSIEGEYLNGFHFRSERKTHPGVVVVFGGSEGSPDYYRAEGLADDGYEVLSLFFWGQPNQQQTLANVPLDQFDEIETYINDNVADARPLTVVGTSKGAEFVELLAANGFPVDNVVAFVPAHYSYTGLEFGGREEPPSFTLRGEPVPFATFRSVPPGVMGEQFWHMITGHPVSYRATYESAASSAPDDARIDLTPFTGNVLVFAGRMDRMWQSDTAAEEIAHGPNFEAHIYDDAGHVFFPTAPPDGWQFMLGGTPEGNREAYDDSERIVRDRLAQWHGTAGS